MELLPDGQTRQPQPCIILSTIALRKPVYESVYLRSVFSIWQSYLCGTRVLKHTTGKERITPCPLSLNEKSGSSEINKKKEKKKRFQSLPPPCSPLSGLTLTLKWGWPHHKFGQIITNDMILTPPDSFLFLFFSWAVLHFAWVCGSVPLLSGPPDSTLTVRQRSRKMAVIHFVPRHRQGSFSLLPITSRPDSASQQDTAPFPLWPRPTVLQGAEVSGRPTSDSVSATRNLPKALHSTSRKNCNKRWQPWSQSD